jgi:diamine N-acetyltransferase
MVGYVLTLYDYDEEVYDIWHMMIDKNFQGKGYGKEALKQVFDYISSKPFGPSRTVVLTCNPGNEVAMHLYHQIGFTETGRSDGDEVELQIGL